MTTELKQRIYDAVEACRAIQSFTADVTLDDYDRRNVNWSVLAQTQHEPVSATTAKVRQLQHHTPVAQQDRAADS